MEIFTHNTAYKTGKLQGTKTASLPTISNSRMDFSQFRQTFELKKIHYHSWKEHLRFGKIVKFEKNTVM